MNPIETIKADYEKFPANQSYDLYTEDVYFKDPLTEFQGLQRYQSLIDFISTWFKAINLELHEIYQVEDTIYTQWTLNWTTPLPWQPRISIPGRSELKLNAEQKIISHIDYWHCSRWEVLKQHFPL
jgi:hypothetical protein